MKIFIDTNVLLDLLVDREPFSDVATKVFDRIEREGHEAFISAISFNNSYYVASKSVGRIGARECVVALRQLCQGVPLEDKIIDKALATEIKDFEDAIQSVSASEVEASFIVTRNPRDFKTSKLQAYAPEEVLAFMNKTAS